MRRWDGVVDKYSAELVTRGLAPATVENRTTELLRFGRWVRRRRPRPSLEQVDADLVVRYIRARTAFHSRSTVGGVVSTLRCMGEFLVQEGLWRANPLRWLRGPKLDQRRRIPQRIGQDELKALWDAAHERRQEHHRYQAVCVLALLYATGLRRGELERLTLDDWDRENAVLKIDGRKTGHARHVPVGESVWRCVEAYLPRRHNRLEKLGRVDERALLLNNRGQRLNGNNIITLIQRLGQRAGVPGLTVHRFRHSCASDLLEAGVPLPQVKQILGHAVIETTVRYLDIANPERLAAISKHPINRFLVPTTEMQEAS
jgi:site-specific recombinase XerD